MREHTEQYWREKTREIDRASLRALLRASREPQAGGAPAGAEPATRGDSGPGDNDNDNDDEIEEIAIEDLELIELTEQDGQELDDGEPAEYEISVAEFCSDAPSVVLLRPRQAGAAPVHPASPPDPSVVLVRIAIGLALICSSAACIIALRG